MSELSRLRIFVDGERMQNVTSFSVVQGFVVRVKLDDNGKALVHGDEIVTETLWGNVMVEEIAHA